jgi:hypothetical protein
VAFLWSHDKEVLTRDQIAAYGAVSWSQRGIPPALVEQQRSNFGLAAIPWIATNMEFVLFMAAHTAGSNHDDRDECYRGAREAIRAGQAFHQDGVEVYDDLARSIMDIYRVIEEETWYDKWKEWWHNRDILTSRPTGVNPYRLDLTTQAWSMLVDDHNNRRYHRPVAEDSNPRWVLVQNHGAVHR